MYVTGRTTEPRVVRCLVARCENVGIHVTDEARGFFEENDICGNALAGVWVNDEADPMFTLNHIHHGRDVGVFVYDSGRGHFDRNNIYCNRIAGFEVRIKSICHYFFFI